MRTFLDFRVFFCTGLVALMSACGNPSHDFGSEADGGSAGESPEQSSSDTGGTKAEGGSPANAGGASESRAGEGGAGEGGAGESGAGESGAGEAGAAGGSGMPPVTADCVAAAQRSCAEAGLLGSCAGGVQTCGADQQWGTCSVLSKPKDTCTAGNDDSCNGMANEGCGCVVGAERDCVGVQGNCAAGKQTCPDGVWSSCSIKAAAQDSCTAGDDANCNGKPNEGCSCKNGDTQACGPLALGICKPGTSTCSGGAWGACVGAVVAAARDCRSAADNDCNGSPDNTIDSVCACHPTDQQACGTHPNLDGKGICHAGSQTCNAASNNSSSSWGSCSGSVGPSSRNCNSSTDNDCNGVADNTVDSVCQCGSGCPADSVCKNLTSSSQCVACQANTDCKNGGTCNTTTNTCSCSSRYNGKTCRFLAFRGVGVLANDTQSRVNAISRDGTVVVGNSSGGLNFYEKHAFRSVDGAPMQFIPELSSETPNTGCDARGVDSSGRVFGNCEGSDPFQYTPATMSVAIDMGTYNGSASLSDVSQDGSVIVGYASPQAFRRTSQGVTQLGVLEPGGMSSATAVSGDGAVVVGWDSSGNNDSAWIWRSSTGIVPLAKLAGWINSDAWDVSTDGKVVVGFADGNCIKWTGSPLSPSVVGPGGGRATNKDGSVIVGDDLGGNIAMVWDGTAHKVSELLGATPDLAGWTLSGAWGVSDDGKFVVGNGTNTANGAHSEGWVAHLP